MKLRMTVHSQKGSVESVRFPSYCLHNPDKSEDGPYYDALATCARAVQKQVGAHILTFYDERDGEYLVRTGLREGWAVRWDGSFWVRLEKAPDGPRPRF